MGFGARKRAFPAASCRRIITATVFLLAALSTATRGQAAVPSVEELRGLTIEELGNIEVTSVFKRPEPVSETPASVYVITREDILRSAATSLPEVLRLAPNLYVARVNAREYAISARGFGSFEASNKLLVMIDGRSIYTPFHGGVFWDQQQVMLDDIERIEVISGPGGTLWGANAVNGVINIITRSARDTQGGLAGARYGTHEAGVQARYGDALGASGAWRAYGMGFETEETVDSDGIGRGDDWHGRQAGFRADWETGRNDFTIQGDAFDNDIAGGATNEGGNVLARWRHRLSDSSSLDVQAYYDRVDREASGVLDLLETADIDARHSFTSGRHQIVWGGGYRMSRDEFRNTANVFVVEPPKETIGIGNVFAQDSISLRPDLKFTVGLKYEHSSYSGGEFLPSARLAWQVSARTLLWAAVSRAVRTPSRIDRDLVGAGITERATGFEPEELIAYELGYRGQLTDRASLSTTLYYHDYTGLRVLTTSPSSGLLVFDNAMDGYTWGVESWANYRVTERWRLAAGVNLLRKGFDLAPGATTLAIDQHQGNDPKYQAMLRSYLDITDRIQFDLSLRAVDDLELPSVPGYFAVDARLGWQVTERFDVEIAGTNLLDQRHSETGAAATRAEIPRAVYVSARVRF